jgi:hypothetical protein
MLLSRSTLPLVRKGRMDGGFSALEKIGMQCFKQKQR